MVVFAGPSRRLVEVPSSAMLALAALLAAVLVVVSLPLVFSASASPSPAICGICRRDQVFTTSMFYPPIATTGPPFDRVRWVM